jgi:broad specificity phosphatase PhoE
VTKKIVLLRHAVHAGSESRRFYGSTDINLSDYGHRQAASAVSVIQEYRPLRYFCSPLQRCLETIRTVTDAPIEILPDLREIDFGSWEGKTFDEIQTADPALVDRWAEFDPAFAFPGGERLGDFMERIRRVASFLVSVPEQTVLAVTHAGVIRSLICHYLGLNPRNYVLFNVDYCSLSVLEIFEDKGVLLGLNYHCSKEKI